MGLRGPKPKFDDISCTNEECGLYGITEEANIVGNGTYQTKSGSVRKYICRSCVRVFCDRTNNAFSDPDPELKYAQVIKLYYAFFNYCRGHGSLKFCDESDKIGKNSPARAEGSIEKTRTLHELLTFPYHITSTSLKVTTAICRQYLNMN